MKKFNLMLEFGNSIYYFDLNELNKKITIVNGDKTSIEKETTKRYDKDGVLLFVEENERVLQAGNEIDMARYDILKIMIEYIMDYNLEVDETLGSERALNGTSVSFKIIFNTLINEGILKEK